MHQPSDLSQVQFDRVAALFGEILSQDLDGKTARALIRERAGDDEAVAQCLRDMLSAHESESDGDDDGGLQASAFEAVCAEVAAANTDIDRAVPDRIGPYRIIRFVAAGGMGTVYEAEQEEPQRRVAIKVIRLELLSPESIQRFEAEGHLLAGLQHEGIARVFAMGRMQTPAGDVPYLVLELVEGDVITDHVRKQGLDVRARIEILRAVCTAVQYAHDNGVLHRDLKPGNILVDARARPRVLDFGIARPFDDARSHASLTASGLLLGTLAYLSPEQAVRTGTPPDVRVDVYGVGAVGYELLTGRPPHDIEGVPLNVAVDRVAHHEPVALGQHDPALGGDLSAIFSKALASERERRYRSVRELDDDLRRYLEHEPIQARAPSAFYQLTKLVRRHRTTAALLTLLVSTLIAGLLVALSERRSAMDAEEAARRVAREAMEDRGAAQLHAAWSALEAGRILQASEILDRSGKTPAGVEFDLLRAQTHQAWRLRVVPGLPGRAYVTISPSAKQAVTRDAVGRIMAIDLEAGTMRPLLADGSPGPAGWLTYGSRQPDRVIVEATDRLTVIDASRGVVLRTVDASAPTVDGLAPSQDLWLWGTPSEERLRLVDLETGVVVDDPQVRARVPAGRSAALVAGRYLLSHVPGHRVDVLDLQTMRVRYTAARVARLLDPQLSADGRFLILGFQYPDVHDLETGATWHVGAEEGMVLLDVAFSADARTLAMLHVDGRIRLWDLATRRLMHVAWDGRLAQPELVAGIARRALGAIAYHPTTGDLRTVSRGMVADWVPEELPTRLDHGVGGKPFPHVYDLEWHPDGRWLASVGWDERVVIWDGWTGRELGVLDIREAANACAVERRPVEDRIDPLIVTWSPDGESLAVQCSCGWCAVWNVWTRKVLLAGPLSEQLLRLESGGILALDTERGEVDRVALDEAAQQMRQIPLEQRRFRHRHPPAWARDSATGSWPTPAWGYSRSGRRLAEGRHPKEGMANRFRVWDLDDGSRDWEGAVRGDVLCVQLADEGQRLFLGLRAGTIQLYDVSIRKRITIMRAHAHYVMALALSPDGRTLASGSGDGWIRLWPMSSMGERVRRARLADAQRVRCLPAVLRALEATADLSQARRELLADASIPASDRRAAIALLFAASD